MGGYKKPYSFEERKVIHKYLKKGLSTHEISSLMNRSKNGINTEIRKNGGRQNYDAEQAQRKADSSHYDRYHKLSVRNKGISAFKYKQRIENLEMQIEILYETIKEMKRDKENK